MTVSARRISYGGPPVVFSIRMRTGRSAQTAEVGLTQSGWPQAGVFGSPFRFASQRISGAGKITGSFSPGGGGLPGGVPICTRGFVDSGGGVVVSLPANSLTTLSYKVGLAAPAWPGLRPTIGAYVSAPAVNPGKPYQSLETQPLTVVGNTGVEISLFTSIGKTRRPVNNAFVPARGTALITGRTEPHLAGRRLRIAAETYVGEQRLDRTEIGWAKTASDGSFRIRWRPARAGSYLILASLAHPGAGYLPDRGCNLSLTAR